MKRIAVASLNPVKIQAVQEGFERVFPGEGFTFEPLNVPSGVRAQPRSDEETLQGARCRAENAARLAPDADYRVGIEGGVAEVEGEMMGFAWVYVYSSDMVGKSRTASFLIPPRVAALIGAGKELGEANDLVFNKIDSKRNEGAVGILTAGMMRRAELYVPAVILALVPFKNPELFSRP